MTRITTNRSTDLLAVIKEVHPQTRKSKADEMIVDIVLVDSSVGSSATLAAIDVSVFGKSKIQQLKAAVGTPMAIFNLSITFGQKGDTPKLHTTVNTKSLLRRNALRHEMHQNAADLKATTDTEKLTQVLEPSETRDASGPQTLSCAALMDYTTQPPEAAVPIVNQPMWVHIEEPEPAENILFGDRIWFKTRLRDNSGEGTVEIPQRTALELAKVQDNTLRLNSIFHCCAMLASAELSAKNSQPAALLRLSTETNT